MANPFSQGNCGKIVLSSQASPIPSLSASSCKGLAISGQLSLMSRTPSLSSSSSQAFPSPSPSVSSWSSLAIVGQLSLLSKTVSLSESELLLPSSSEHPIIETDRKTHAIS